MTGLWLCYIPIHDVAPSAVTIAVATDAIICTMNLMVSFFVIILMFCFTCGFYGFYGLSSRTPPLCHLEHLPFVISSVLSPLCHFERSREISLNESERLDHRQGISFRDLRDLSTRFAWSRWQGVWKVGPIIINSGFRNPDVNRRVGGVKNSQHLQGCAADVRPQDPIRFPHLVDFLKTHKLTDQLLTGNGWLHISWKPFAAPRHYIRIGYYK